MSWERIRAEIEAVPALTIEQERALAVAIRAGEGGAKKELIAANLQHAIPIALALSRGGQRWEPGDLIGEAVRAMDGAAERWDGRVPFGAYVRHRIRGAMKDFLRRRANVLRTPDGADRVISFDAGTDDTPDPYEGGMKLAAGYDVATASPDPVPSVAFTAAEKRVMEATVLRQPRPGNVREACQELKLNEATVRRLLRSALRKCAATGSS